MTLGYCQFDNREVELAEDATGKQYVMTGIPDEELPIFAEAERRGFAQRDIAEMYHHQQAEMKELIEWIKDHHHLGVYDFGRPLQPRFVPQRIAELSEKW